MSKSLTIPEWMELSYSIAEEKGWHDDVTNSPPAVFIAAKLMKIVTELSEACEEIAGIQGATWDRNNGWGEDGIICDIYVIDKASGKPEGFPVELADAIIRIFDLAALLGLPLEEAMNVKTEYNRTRSYRHGGKSV